MRTNVLKTGKKLISIILLMCLLFSAMIPVYAQDNAKEVKDKKVLIGFLESNGMFSRSAKGNKSGYCYDYMMEVATYAGWDCDFCYGSFDALYNLLKAGAIDVLPYTNKNDERSKEVLFSKDALLDEEYYIAVKPEGDFSSSEDIKNLNGKTIATITGADFNSLLEDYIEQNNLDLKIEYYPEYSEIWGALKDDEVDATVFTSLSYSNDNFKCIASFGEKPTYVAVSKGREDLLQQLNDASTFLANEYPALHGDLYEKYFPDNPMRKVITSNEKEYIENHPILRVGCFKNDAPYIYSYDNRLKKAVGLVPDLINGIISRMEINVKAEFLCYDSLSQMTEALDTGEIDVIAPFYPDFSIAEKNGLIVSNSFRSSNMELVFKKGVSYKEALTKVATPATKLGIFYVEENYPNSEIVRANSIEDAVEKVVKGEAKGAIAQNVVTHSVKEKYDNLNSMVLPEGCGTCFAARPNNYPLITILNRGIKYFSDAEIASISSKYALETTVTAKEFLAANKEYIIIIVVIIVALIVMTFMLFQLVHLKKKADESNKSKTAFLFNMSHDIRTPMNAIIGFTDLAKKNVDDKEKLLDSLNKTQQSSNLLLSLINSILDMSRIEAGKAVLKEDPGDIRYSFLSIESTMRELALQKNIDLQFEVGEIEDPYVYADYDRCMRIFINIISNAIKYTNEGGTVKVKCEQIGKKNKDCGIYQYTFEDNGIGMSEEFLEHVFDKFSREENSTTSGVQGTGLGLSVCKSFVDLMNGKIECESKQDKGTKFTITLPLKIQTDKEKKQFIDPNTGYLSYVDKDDEENVGFSGKKVLLVEDNELNLEITVEILEEAGLIVDTAKDGSIAVEILKEKGPDLYDFILMDVQMPIMNGYEATKKIREMYPDENIPIIALSANAFEEDKQTSIKNGMNDHVAKPININDLFSVVSKYV